MTEHPKSSVLRLEPGVVLADKFRVEKVLGVGGMGAVVAATHLQLDELVAIKVLLPHLASSPEAAARFEREARASVKIRSEYVVRVLDVAKLPDGTPYMVMEHLIGRDLSDLIQQQGALDPGFSVALLLQACDAIAAAHALGIVHRDIKPSNLYCAQGGDGTLGIKVLDFGISKVVDAISKKEATLTKTSAVMGSPLYMAPEQMQSSKHVDNRTDIWALGCVLFEMVVGRAPFLADTMPELCARILTQPAPTPSSLRSGIPAELDQVILCCLAKSPHERFQDVGKLARALQPFAPQCGDLVDRIARRISRESIPSAHSSAPAPAPAPAVGQPPAVSAQTGTAWGNRTELVPLGSFKSRWLTKALFSLLGVGALAVVVGFLRSESVRGSLGSTRASAASAPNAPTQVNRPSLVGNGDLGSPSSRVTAFDDHSMAKANGSAEPAIELLDSPAPTSSGVADRQLPVPRGSRGSRASTGGSSLAPPPANPEPTPAVHKPALAPVPTASAKPRRSLEMGIK